MKAALPSAGPIGKNSSMPHCATDQAPAKIEEAAALRLVVEGTVSETGEEFFRALVQNLAHSHGTAGAWVTEWLPESRKLRTLAMWLDGN